MAALLPTAWATMPAVFFFPSYLDVDADAADPADLVRKRARLACLVTPFATAATLRDAPLPAAPRTRYGGRWTAGASGWCCPRQRGCK